MIPTSIENQLNALKGVAGSYILVIRVKTHCKIITKSKRKFSFLPGLYLYTGSAKGIGSTSLGWRLRRHLQSSFGFCHAPTWHVDFLLKNSSSEVLCIIVFIPGSQLSECELIKRLKHILKGAEIVEGFGSSDCSANCGGHLLNTKTDMWKTLQDFLHPLNSESEERIDILTSVP